MMVRCVGRARRLLCWAAALAVWWAAPAAVSEDGPPEEPYINITYDAEPFVRAEGRYLDDSVTLFLSLLNNAEGEGASLDVREIRIRLPDALVLGAGGAEEPVRYFSIDSGRVIGPQERAAFLFDVMLVTNESVDFLPLEITVAGEGFPPVTRTVSLPVFSGEAYLDAGQARPGEPLAAWNEAFARFHEKLARQSLFPADTFDFLFISVSQRLEARRSISEALSAWTALSCLTEAPFAKGSALTLRFFSTQYNRPVALTVLAQPADETGERALFAWYATGVEGYGEPRQLAMVSLGLPKAHMPALANLWIASGAGIAEALAGEEGGGPLPASLAGEALLTFANGMIAATGEAWAPTVVSLGNLTVPIP